MIYRYYYHGPATERLGDEHRYGQWLLAYALYFEKKLSVPQRGVIRNEWGKPFLRDHPDIEFNISHCSGLVGCVISDVPVGIDVESVRPFSRHAARHVCSRDELNDIETAQDPDRRFFIYWTLKESCAKAMGSGLCYPLKDITFKITEQRIDCETQPDYQFLLIENKSFITSVCYRRGGQSVRIFG